MSDRPDDLSALFAAHLETVRDRHRRALRSSGFDAVLVHSGSPPLMFEDDQNYPFKANPAFKAWAPLTDVADCWLYFERDGERPLLLFSRPESLWHKAAAVPDSYWSGHFDLRPVGDRSEARAALPTDLSRTACIGEPGAPPMNWGVGAVNPHKLVAALDFERAVKTPYELACLRRANELGARGHRAVARAFADGASEFEMELAFLAACELRVQELPYDAVIALNESAAILNYQMLERRAPLERHSLLIDAGAGFAGYASDITRTYSFRDADFAALIGRVDEMQQALCTGVHAGVDWRDVHLTAHRLTAELLQEADIISCDADEALDTGLSSVFLPHGIGHLLGLQVHDVGGRMRSSEGGEIPRPDGHPLLRLTRVLEAGFVVTMEPGIYFIDQLLAEAQTDSRGRRINWSRIEQLRRFGGIRIEDDLVVTPTGCDNLTREAFAAMGE